MSDRFIVESNEHTAGERMQALFDKCGENSLCTWVICSVREGDSCNRVYPFPYSFFGTVLPNVEAFILNTPRYNDACRRYIDAIEAHKISAVNESISANKCTIIGTFLTVDAAGILLEHRCYMRRQSHEEMVNALKRATVHVNTENAKVLLERARIFLRSFDFRLAEGHNDSTVVLYKDKVLLTLYVDGEVGITCPSAKTGTRPLFNILHASYAIACDLILHARRAYLDQQELDLIATTYALARDMVASA